MSHRARSSRKPSPASEMIEQATLNCDDFENIDDEAFISAYSSHEDVLAANPTGYCVDSVEPKCNEIKRLIGEFKTNFSIKLNMIKHNKLLVQKLNIIKDIYSDGVLLYNEQSLVNLTADKAKVYLSQIDAWLSDTDRLGLASSRSDSVNLANTLSFLTIEQINESILETKCAGHKEDLILNLDIKRENLLKSIDVCMAQLRSLRETFGKRQQALLRANYKVVEKPVLRVEPQQCKDLEQNKIIIMPKRQDISGQSNPNKTLVVRQNSFSKVNTF